MKEPKVTDRLLLSVETAEQLTGITKMQVSRWAARLKNPDKFKADICQAAKQRAMAIEAMDVHFSSATPEWYTPPEIIERVIQTLGAIDLDPCSNAKGKPNMPASKHFTMAEDGLTQPWIGRVYMNPPYGREIGQWAIKLLDEYRAGNVSQAVALVPARTDTEWFQTFRDAAVCFIDGRLKFSGQDNSAPFPSAVMYLGPNVTQFHKAFNDMGDIWVRWDG